MIKKLSILMILFMALTACATGGSSASSADVKSTKRDLDVHGIFKMKLKEIDLGKWRLTCKGEMKEMFDQIEGVTVKGIICSEKKYVTFAYFFNDAPFFYAIMEINEKGDSLTPLKGFGAFKQGRIMKETDLTGRPQLPDWAYGPDGKPRQSIYLKQKQATQNP